MDQKALKTMPAPKYAPKPADYLCKLSKELLVLIARFYLQRPARYLLSIRILTHVNSRLRQVLIATPDLWTNIALNDIEGEGARNVMRLFIKRSQPLPLIVQLYSRVWFHWSGLPGSFYDVLLLAAPRIRILTTYMNSYIGLNLIRGVLEKLDMPMLEEIDLDYDTMMFDGPDRTMRIPSSGTNLRTLSLTGLLPINSNLSNIRSLTLGTGAFWKWTTSSLSAVVMQSTSLERLTFVGSESTFNIEADSTEFVLHCPSLRYLGMEGGIAAKFTTRLLLALHAPNLETVHVITPTASFEELTPGVLVDWEKVKVQLDKKHVEGTFTFGNVRSLVINRESEWCGPRRTRNFFPFLMEVFPQATSLDLDVAESGVLSICKEKNDWLDGGWVHLNKLILRGNPSLHALECLLAFVRARKGTGPVEYEKGREEVDDYDGERENRSASTKGKNQAGGVVGAEADEEKGRSFFASIETVVIKGRKVSDAASSELIRLLGEEVQVVEIAASISAF